MKNLKAFTIIGLITASVGAVLFAFDAHLNYRNILWAASYFSNSINNTCG
jgi:hypothetical protein